MVEDCNSKPPDSSGSRKTASQGIQMMDCMDGEKFLDASLTLD